MKKSPIYPKHETEFDPQLDFEQFLEEAKAHSTEGNFGATTPHSSEEAGGKQFGGEEKRKKSWRKSLFSWLKSEKKCKPPMPIKEEEASNKSNNSSKTRRSYVSGPINGSGSNKIGLWPRRSDSGPLTVTDLFNPTKRMEKKMPYVSLDQLHSPPRFVQSYGPVYMVS